MQAAVQTEEGSLHRRRAEWRWIQLAERNMGERFKRGEGGSQDVTCAVFAFLLALFLLRSRTPHNLDHQSCTSWNGRVLLLVWNVFPMMFISQTIHYKQISPTFDACWW